MKQALSLHIQVDAEGGKIMALYLKFREGRSVETKEFSEGVVFADYDRQGRLLGIELLAPTSRSVLERILRDVPKQTRRVVRDTIPSKMLAAAG